MEWNKTKSSRQDTYSLRPFHPWFARKPEHNTCDKEGCPDRPGGVLSPIINPTEEIKIHMKEIQCRRKDSDNCQHNTERAHGSNMMVREDDARKEKITQQLRR